MEFAPSKDKEALNIQPPTKSFLAIRKGHTTKERKLPSFLRPYVSYFDAFKCPEILLKTFTRSPVAIAKGLPWSDSQYYDQLKNGPKLSSRCVPICRESHQLFFQIRNHWHLSFIEICIGDKFITLVLILINC